MGGADWSLLQKRSPNPSFHSRPAWPVRTVPKTWHVCGPKNQTLNLHPFFCMNVELLKTAFRRITPFLLFVVACLAYARQKATQVEGDRIMKDTDPVTWKDFRDLTRETNEEFAAVQRSHQEIRRDLNTLFRLLVATVLLFFVFICLVVSANG